MKKTSLLGIEINDSEIKFFRHHKGKEMPVLSVATPKDTFYDGEITNIDSFSEYLVDIMKKNKLHSKKIGLVIDSTQTIIRPFQIKNQKDDRLLRNAIELQISEVFNDILKTHIMGIKLASRTKETATGLLTLVPYEIVHSQYMLSEKMKKKVEFIDIQQNCIAKYYSAYLKEQHDVNTSIIINIERHVCLVNLIHRNRLIYTKSQWIKSPEKDAHIDEEVNKQIDEDNMRLILEMTRQSIDYAIYNQLEEPVDSIFLCVNSDHRAMYKTALESRFTQKIIDTSSDAMHYGIKGALIRCKKESVKEI